MKSGIVVSHFGVEVLVEFTLTERESIRISRRQSFVVGDRVTIQNGRASRLERDNVLVRKNKDASEQIIAANLNTLGIVVSLVPKSTLAMVDHIVVAARAQGIKPYIVVNKMDIENSHNLLSDMRNDYGDEIQVFGVSGKTKEGLQELMTFLSKSGRSALVGVSGAGKSTLTNSIIPDANLTTHFLSRSDAQGQHTTSVSTLHKLVGGGELVDTPGVRDFVPVLNAQQLAQYFPGFENILENGCRFRDCMHYKEPGCVIIEAVNSSKLDTKRYQRYVSLLLMLQQETERYKK